MIATFYLDKCILAIPPY